jgi:iron complex outermembrane receptor protein
MVRSRDRTLLRHVEQSRAGRPLPRESEVSPARLALHGKAFRDAVCALFLLALDTEAWPRGVQHDPQEEEPLKRLSLEQLGNVEVTTASKEPKKLTRPPAAIYVLTQEDIRRSGATSLPELLRLVPGVEVGRINSNRWALGVRGFESRLSRAVLVLIDGRSVYSPLFHGVYWEVQDTLLEDIERIEVIRGPGGTIWGANAVNAVINIITKSAKDTHGTLFSVGGGNIDQGAVGFRYGGGSGNNLHYRFYGKGFSRGPEFHPDGRQFDDWRMGQAGFRADWESNRRDTLTLQGDIYDGDAGERVTIARYSPPSAMNVEGNAELAGGNLQARWRRVLAEGSDVQLQVYYDRTSRQEPNFGETRDTFDIDFIHHLTLPGGHDFIWGLGTRLSPDDITQVVPTYGYTPARLTDQLYSAFVQDEIPILENQLSFTIGSKFLHVNYTGFDVQPSARLLWTPSAQQTFWAAVTRAVRTPSRNEEGFQNTTLASAAQSRFRRFIGDGTFVPEQLVGYGAGYRSLVKPSLYVDIAAFYNSLDHLLGVEPGDRFREASPSPPHLVDPSYVRNPLLGTTSGIEIAPDWRPKGWWRLQGSYSYLHMDLKTRTDSRNTTTVASTEGSSPHHQVVIQSFLDLPRNMEFDQTYRYVSGLPAQGLGGYHTADARLGWRPNSHLELSLAGQNLLQPHHAEFGGDPGPNVEIRRSVYGKLTFRW